MTERETGRGIKLGFAGYARCLAEVVRQKDRATVDDIADVVNTNRRKGLQVANALERVGLIRVASWVPMEDATGRCTFWTPAYALGAGPRPPHPNGATGKPRRSKIPVSVHALAIAVDVLQESPKNVTELSDALETSPAQVQRIVRVMREERLVHISGWHIRPQGGVGGAMYEWGPGKADKSKPKPQTKRQNWAKANARKIVRQKHLRLLAATAGPIRAAEREMA